MPGPIWNQKIYYELLSHFTKGRRWLDLGCGRGPDEQALVRMRQRMGERFYVGVDADMDSLKDSRGGEQSLRRCGSLPLPDDSFDVVTSNMVLKHLNNPVAALQEANRVLDEGGILIVHTALSHHYMLLAGRLLSKILPRTMYRDLVSLRLHWKKKAGYLPNALQSQYSGKIVGISLQSWLQWRFCYLP